MSRGVDGRDVFRDTDDRRRFLAELDRASKSQAIKVLAYCLMGNHFHLALQVTSHPLSEFMQRLLTNYSRAFNLRHARTGHLFQARYRAIICVADAYLRRIIRYIHLNPVRAMLVVKPRDWPWSSASESPNGDESDDLGDFDPWQGADAGATVLIRPDAKPSETIDRLGAAIAERAGMSIATLRSETRLSWVIEARVALMNAALREGCSPADVARWLGTSSSSTARYLAKIRACSKEKPQS